MKYHHLARVKPPTESMREAFGDATRRLALTGIPFRSDDSEIPFVTYEPDGAGSLLSRTMIAGRPSRPTVTRTLAAK